jgi:hypothetical protein
MRENGTLRGALTTQRRQPPNQPWTRGYDRP